MKGGFPKSRGVASGRLTSKGLGTKSLCIRIGRRTSRRPACADTKSGRHTAQPEAVTRRQRTPPHTGAGRPWKPLTPRTVICYCGLFVRCLLFIVLSRSHQELGSVFSTDSGKSVPLLIKRRGKREVTTGCGAPVHSAASRLLVLWGAHRAIGTKTRGL